jgi:hypothetical protein
MKHLTIAVCLALTTLAAAPAFPQKDGMQGEGKVVVTILPKKDGALPPNLTGQEMSLKVNGKTAKITALKPFQSPENNIELVLLIDGSARSSLGVQLSSIEGFIKSLPPNVKSAIAYMVNGNALFAGPLSSDHAQVLSALHLPGGVPGGSASPYFCLSDLAKRWPGADPAARREVIMISDGVDPYHMRYDLDDPYIQTAIDDSIRARLVVYSLYWQSIGTGSNRYYENSAGQSNLDQLTQATGGTSFWLGMGNPVSFDPYFDELTHRFLNQYALEFTTGAPRKPQIEAVNLKLRVADADVNTPEKVLVNPTAIAKD